MFTIPTKLASEKIELFANVRDFLFLGILCWLTVLSALCYGADQSSIPWRNLELVLRGDQLRACAVAYADFNEKIAQKGQTHDSLFIDYMSQIGNYNIELSAGSGRYYVHIYPRLSERFPGVFGGDAEYVIDAKTFELLEKRYGK